MTVAGLEAWITSAVNEKCVNKAITLAGSLRRVRTAKKLVVLTTLDVSVELREKLKETFDLVLLLDPKTQNGWNLEDYAKIHGFSLVVFNKCVYLSPNALVLKNCDEIFVKYVSFGASQLGPKNDIDPSIYLYVPRLDCSRSLAKVAHYVGAAGGDDFTKYFNLWLRNQIPNIEKLDEKYNLRLKLKGDVHQSLNSNASILNFVDLHPLDFPEEIMKKTSNEIGTLEKFAVDYCWEIYMESVKKSPLDSPQISFKNEYKTEPIAIVGMSFRLPGGNNPEEFWSLLAEGKGAVVPVPSHRWTKEHSYYPCKNRKVEIGFLNVPIDEFDGKFFGLSPKEAEFLDPQQRLLLEVTWEALEDAMIDPSILRGSKTGVFVGSWLNDYKDICCRSVDVDFFRTYMGNSIGSSSARISHFLQTTGPSIATESGCSSAIAAVDMACKSLKSGDSDLAFAAGVNLLLHPFQENMLEYVISPDFRCKTFDAEANGFARAEACAVILMKRLSDAVRDGDNIWGLIRGTALTQEGLSKSLGTPTVHSESMAMELALQNACVDPKDVSYIEAHGTGTAVGDPMEILSITKAYSKSRNEPLVIGSVKTNVGHTESVSGLTGIIKVLLSMKNEMIPKHLNLNTLNPHINLEAIPAQIPLEPLPWPRNDKKPRIAGVSSFGISGTDGHAIIEEPPCITQSQLEFNQERPLHIMKISAKSSESMEELVKKYHDLFLGKIARNEDIERDFANLAHSANIGRGTFNHRAVIVAKNFKEAAKILEEKSFKHEDVQQTSQGLCFLFTGQGSQYPKMGKQLYETSPVFRDNFDKCDEILRRWYNISIKKVVWASEGNSEDLSRTLYSQTSIFVMEYCLLKLWESWGIKPDYVMGHSLGEFAAAVSASALNLEDALMLVAERSRLIDSLPRGKMLVIRADKRTVDATISEYEKVNPDFWVDYAALNSPDQTVIAGESGMIEEFEKFCSGKSLKTIVLPATHAFHSRHMEPMLDAYRRVASTVMDPEIKDDLPKFISGMEGKLVEIDELNADYWVRHTREKVNFIDACKVVKEEGCSLFLEVGPHPVLSALTMMNMDGISHQIKCLPSIRRKEEEWVTLLDTLSKLYLSDWKGEIDWKGFDRFYPREKVRLPFYPFTRKPTWTKFEKNYWKIHPLIGSIVPCSLGDTIYQSSLTLKNTAFVQDHVIGNTVVFPGAGFLEMCLAGGHSTVQGFKDDFVKPRRPVILKSLKIASPLALCESQVCKLQTVITLNDKHSDNGDNEESDWGYSVQVHQQQESDDGDSQWIHHASAKFLPVVPALEKEVVESIDVSYIQSKSEKSDNKDFYEKLPDIGLRFGPKFRSLEYGWKSEKGLLTSIKVPEDHRNYLIHPVVVDAMFQTVMLWTAKEQLKKKLQVPVQIGEFIWLKDPSESKSLFAYATTSNNGVYCKLVDEDGTPLAYMKGLDFIETTAKLVEGMITQQSTKMPKLWEDVWKPSRGPMQGYLKHVTPPEQQPYSEEDLKDFEEKNTLPEEELKFYLNLVNRNRLSILKALYLLGWKPELGEPFSIDFLMTTFKIKENFRHFIRFFMRSMAQEGCGWLKAIDEEENTFKFVREPQSMEEIQAGLNYVTSPYDVTQEEYKLAKEIEANLVKIFLGEVDPLQILFPENPGSKPSAGKCYECGARKLKNPRHLKKMDMHMQNAFQIYSLQSQVQSQSPQSVKPTYRVLEVGSGSAVFSDIVLNHIFNNKDLENFDIEFYFTDVSPAFFTSAEKLLKDYLKHIVFRKYDMEKDPLEQGFCPGYFDMVMATEVFHIAKDLKKTMRSVRSLLKTGGLLLFVETIYPCERNTFMFGLLDGFWKFEDKDLRKNHVNISSELWEQVLIHSGFHGFSSVPVYNNISGVMSAYAAPIENNFLKGLYPPKYSWIIFGEHDEWTTTLLQTFQNVNRKCIIVPKPNEDEFEENSIQEYIQNALTSALEGVEGGVLEGVLYLWSLCPNTRDQSKVSLPFLTLMKLVSQMKVPPKVFPVLRGAHSMDTYDVVDPTPGTLVGFCKSITNENSFLKVNCFDIDPNINLQDQNDELFMNLWVEQTTNTAFRDGLRFRPKLIKGKVLRNEPLSLPNGCDRFQLVLPKTRLISDLEFGYLEPTVIDGDLLEVQVRVMGLNFRDVFTVIKPIADFEKWNSVGLEYAGVVVQIGENVTKFKIGDRVLGLCVSTDLSLPSHIKTIEKMVVPIPKTMTFTDAATLPAVFTTALHCLINLAEMKKGETVLIHTASGGVGLVAIQLCKHVGANIIATAGSPRKRAYLRNLGIQHVFHSRTLDFKENILELTSGRGVDIVLNSLTGPGFKEASMDVLCKNGRFIEMSKLNVWTPEEVKVLRPDVYYELVDMTKLELHEYDRLNQDLQKFMETGWIKPIAHERFDVLNIRGALNYLQKAKHIGKIVCIFPEVKLEKSKFVTTTPLFNELSTYLVTGGLGGIGFEVVKWYLRNGAKHVAIVSRSSPSQDIAAQIEKFNWAGNHVKAFSVDVGDYEKLKSIFHDLPNHGFPKLRGIMHAAGVLKDGVLENQSWDTFRHTYKPKVDGSWNLHELTKNLVLEHFVLFSSMAATVGTPGQGNHSASNSFEDSLAAYRRSNGLPATCINWGNWGEVGVATEVDFPGVRPISTSQGLLVLETFLKTQTDQMSVMNVESFGLLVKLFPLLKNTLDDTRLLGDYKQSVILNCDEFWNEVDSAPDRDGKINCFKKFIKTIVRNILKMDVDEPIDDLTEFQVLGIDSLMMLEMKNGMQNILGGRMTISANQLKDCNNTEVLANKLVDVLEGGDEDETNLPSHDELLQLIRDDSNLLPETLSVENLERVNISEVETVLLTGATGNLGPYLLRDLTERPQIKKVYCLVRPSGKLSGEERLKKRLEQIRIIDFVDFNQIEVIEGDITKSKFGLAEELHKDLCETVDVIIHNAVKADHTAKYWKAPESKANHIRTVNVIGTLRVLEFAAEKKVKHFFYSSAILAYTGKGKSGQPDSDPEGWQDVSAFDSFKNAGNAGYVLSKHISEQLIYNAIGKGIPCKAFRFPVITGDSKTGRVDYLQNHALLRWMTCMKIGVIHDLPAPLITFPVDHCAKISLDIFFNPDARNDVYNVVTKEVVVEQVLVEVAQQFGVEIKTVSYQEFIDILKVEDDNSPVAPFTKLYVDAESEFIANFENPSFQGLKKYLENSENFIGTSKLRKYAPDYDDIVEETSRVLTRDFKYLRDEGVFHKFGIKICSGSSNGNVNP